MGLVVSEVMYYPAEGGGTYEFIELYNNRAVFEDLTGFAFTNGIRYVFEPDVVRSANTTDGLRPVLRRLRRRLDRRGARQRPTGRNQTVRPRPPGLHPHADPESLNCVKEMIISCQILIFAIIVAEISSK